MPLSNSQDFELRLCCDGDGVIIRGHFWTGWRSFRSQVRERRLGKASWAICSRALRTNSAWVASSIRSAPTASSIQRAVVSCTHQPKLMRITPLWRTCSSVQGVTDGVSFFLVATSSVTEYGAATGALRGRYAALIEARAIG